MRPILFVLLLCGFLMPCGGVRAAGAMNTVAERYVRLVLALGQHDPDYVDAFYGPAEWKTQAATEKKSLDKIAEKAIELSADLKDLPSPQSSPSGKGGGDEILKLRREYLWRQISALFA